MQTPAGRVFNSVRRARPYNCRLTGCLNISNIRAAAGDRRRPARQSSGERSMAAMVAVGQGVATWWPALACALGLALGGAAGWRGLFFFQAEDGIRDLIVTGVQTPI